MQCSADPEMNVSLYQAAAAMNAQARWQEVIARNMASGSVPGFRKQEVTFTAVEAGLDPTAAGPANLRYVIPAVSASINFNPGEIRATRNPMDFALEGPGFFEVQLPNGARAYTRDGEFHLNSQGQLVTKQGYIVLGDVGPLQFDVNEPGTVTVSPTGEVSQGTEIKGRIRLVEFSDPRKLTAVGEGYFLADKPETQPGVATATFVQQGFIESSNTSPTAQMTSLITALRMFEANSRVLQMQDERLGRVITELGNPSA
jgi:flagellar basal-body rod protein FlgG